MQRADAYEKRYSGLENFISPVAGSRGAQAQGQGQGPGQGQGQGQGPGWNASPMSRGSTVTSGLFDNLAGADGIQEFGHDRDRDHDGNSSLLLSDSGGGYSDSVYLLPSAEDN